MAGTTTKRVQETAASLDRRRAGRSKRVVVSVTPAEYERVMGACAAAGGCHPRALLFTAANAVHLEQGIGEADTDGLSQEFDFCSGGRAASRS